MGSRRLARIIECVNGECVNGCMFSNHLRFAGEVLLGVRESRGDVAVGVSYQQSGANSNDKSWRTGEHDA
jgi:hypothetical protein